jgi:hypothetical protein
MKTTDVNVGVVAAEQSRSYRALELSFALSKRSRTELAVIGRCGVSKTNRNNVIE